jgi:hypothetical protein
MALLAASPLSRRLRSLDLANNGLTDAAAQALTSGGGLAELRSLGLSWNAIRERGLQALAQARFWPNLTDLDLSFNAITDAGVVELLAVPRPLRLTSLSLIGADISQPLRQALRDHFGSSVCRFD